MNKKFTSKNELRIWAKEDRKNIDYPTILVANLRQTEEYQMAKHVMIFYPKRYEVNLLFLLEDDSKTFYLPKIKDDNLLCCSYRKDTKLDYSCFNTCEPCTKPCDKSQIDLIIVPALCCDKENYRLGYGGGFYDRFLKEIECTKCVCIPQIFILDTVFAEEYDVKIDKIITV